MDIVRFAGEAFPLPFHLPSTSIAPQPKKQAAGEGNSSIELDRLNHVSFMLGRLTDEVAFANHLEHGVVLKH